MAKLLSGAELQGFIKERQARQVRNLRQQYGIEPRLAIVASEAAGEVIRVYTRLKARYGDDIGVAVDIHMVPYDGLAGALEKATSDTSVQGVILQLPIDHPESTDELCSLITPAKDVDGLGSAPDYSSATAEAIDWLLAGYGVDLDGKNLVIVGQGKLVGRPLGQLWQARGLSPVLLDVDSADSDAVIRGADVLVSATGVPRLIAADQIKSGAVVIDAGTASEGGVIVGDVEDAARERSDISITPVKGGVGPLTIAVLFDHVIQACYRQVGKL